MPTFLFWNLNKKPLGESLARLAVQHDPDLLLLAECDLSPAQVLNALNRSGRADYHYAPNRICSKVAIFPRFSDQFLPVVDETDRLTIRRLALPNSPQILLVVVHLISKRHYTDEAQQEGARDLARLIRDAEEKEGHQRTLLVGDLNMNPFEYGVSGAGALNAVMTRSIARRSSRVIQGLEYYYFYNPMWGFFGDRTDDPSGTHYYARSDHLCYFWNLFDQVLLRPGLLDLWQVDSLRIIRSDGVHVFMDENGKCGHPDMSDHLPIVFRLNF